MKKIILILTMSFVFGVSYAADEYPPVEVKKMEEQKEQEIDPLVARDRTVENIRSSLIMIQPGSFQMGSDAGEYHEKPVHTVQITKPFYISDHEVTVGEFRGFNSKAKSSDCLQEDCPVVGVSWHKAQSYIKWLNQTTGTFRLCTEAEWDYAARAGTTGTWSCGNEESCLENHGWYDGNSDHKSHPVKTKSPNPWGLYDIHGNVWEWVQDWKGRYPVGSVIDPSGPDSGYRRVVRGGGFNDIADNTRSAVRYGYTPGYSRDILGFRLCASISP